MTSTSDLIVDPWTLRREIRAERRALTSKARAQRSLSLIAHLLRNRVLWSAERIACFWPNDGEIDLSALFAPLWRRGKQILLPVIDGRTLWFAPYTPTTPLRTNRFGIFEPALKRDKACPLLAIELVLVPLVAFDDHGNRIGMGGGYYDRTFAYLRHRKHLRSTRLIGTAFAFQRRSQLPVKPWDIPLHGALTDKGLHWF